MISLHAIQSVERLAATMFAKLTLVFTLCFFTVGRSCVLENTRNSVLIEKVAEPVEHGEGPHWDDKCKKLYYVDISGQKILRYDPGTGKRTSVHIKDGPVGVVVPVEGTQDKLIAGVGQDVVLVTWDGEQNNVNPPIKKLTSLDTDRTDTRVNDGKCDPEGRFWIGTMGLEMNGQPSEPNRGALYLTNNDGTANKIVSPVTVSNGLTWSLQNDIMYYIDTPTYNITAYDYNNADGSIKNKRTVFNLKANNVNGFPDGMTNDADGNLWIALYNGKAVIKVDPKNGKLLQKIDMPVDKITSVAFGGPELDVLYVTSSHDNVAADSGALFSIKGLGVKGRPSTHFRYLAQ